MSREFKKALEVSIPIFFGYMAIGIAYGLLMVSFDYPWYVAVIMSIFIYAGALQFVLVGLLKAKVGLIDIAIASFFVNIRQAFYGLSLIKKFKDTKPFKNYLIFGLTDETYALLTTITEDKTLSKKHFYLFLNILNQTYWVLGTFIGAVAGSSISFNSDGIEFSLTALFVVLTIEQYKKIKKKTPFIIGAIGSLLATFFTPTDKMLVTAIAISLLFLLIVKAKVENE